ncbi:MAG: AAA family ATPase, partial [Candidatus Natronoplasma sp.]
MKLEKLTLKNWACFRGENEPYEFTEGINLICGKNEAGKSTAIDALRRAFFDKHTTRGSTMQANQPWDSSLPPVVTVEFETDGDVYKIRKQFLKDSSSHLEKKVAGHWESIAEGDEADKRVIEVLGGNLPGRGASGPSNWGIAQALWSRQGEILPDDGFTDETQERIQSIMGSITPSTEGKVIGKKIKKRFQKNWTEVNRQPKAGSKLKELNEKIDQLEEKVYDLNIKLKETEELERELEDLRNQKKHYEEELKEVKESLKEAEEAAEKAEKHRENREKLESTVKELQKRYDDLDEKIGTIEDRRERIEECQKEIEKIEKKEEKYQEELKNREDELSKLNEKLVERKESMDERQDEMRYIRIAYDALRDQKEILELSNKLDKIESLIEKKEEFKKELEKLTAPDKHELKTLRDIDKQIDGKKNELETIGLEASVSAETKLKGGISKNGKKERFDLDEGDAETWSAGRSISIDVEDVVSINVQSGSEDVQSVQEELESLQEDYEAKTAPYSTEDLEELQELLEKKKELKSKIENYNQRIADQTSTARPSYEDMDGVCPYCENEHRNGRPYKNKGSFEKHISDCASDPVDAMKDQLEHK